MERYCTEVEVFTKDMSYLRFVDFIGMLFSGAAAGLHVPQYCCIEGQFYLAIKSF